MVMTRLISEFIVYGTCCRLFKDYTLHNLVQSINKLTSRTAAVLQWIPAHIWKWSSWSDGKNWQQEAATKIKAKLQRSKHVHQKQEARWLQAHTGKWRFYSPTRHPSASIAPRTDHYTLLAQNRPLQTLKPHEENWHWNISPLTLRNGSTNSRTCHAVLP